MKSIYIRIEEDEVGPLSVGQIVEKFRSGKIGPDTLCRDESADAPWQPLSKRFTHLKDVCVACGGQHSGGVENRHYNRCGPCIALMRKQRVEAAEATEAVETRKKMSHEFPSEFGGMLYGVFALSGIPRFGFDFFSLSKCGAPAACLGLLLGYLLVWRTPSLERARQWRAYFMGKLLVGAGVLFWLYVLVRLLAPDVPPILLKDNWFAVLPNCFALGFLWAAFMLVLCASTGAGPVKASAKGSSGV